MYADCRDHAQTARRLPGGGKLDVLGLVSAVRAAGFSGPWCVEVYTPELRALPAGDAAKAAATAAVAVLETAGV